MSNGFLAVAQLLAITVPVGDQPALRAVLNLDGIRLAMLIGVGAVLLAIGIWLTPAPTTPSRRTGVARGSRET